MHFFLVRYLQPVRGLCTALDRRRIATREEPHGFTQILYCSAMVHHGHGVKTRADAMRLTKTPSKFEFEINWDRKVLHGYKPESDVRYRVLYRVQYWSVELTQ